ncbi:MAG: putative colanic acid biosynthesis acetyltransferase [Rhodobacteraceae bacterium]|uniref:putative colanic acid biosynthesis acetyltransferase n=1 Tax=Celeribacter sp. HF31 TaxID=2721558 RepID=UPI00142F69D5|nr:putative colanic acid biosynthesis acetyltransferase [Celeribacter sp. HF31]NIY80918.1 putative colanic acid biosynthesis acetyltransferase [Celeribacter sp. HF31]NVK45137.1 putative colanic acid biosynthesis acetyltransferase [Paracoccaceae bacterium]
MPATPPEKNALSASVVADRDAPNFSFGHRLKRLIWSILWTLLASWTPPQMGAWRRFLLRSFGAKIDRTASVRGGAKIWYPPNLEMAANSVLADRVQCYNMAPISIGEGTIVSQGAFLCGGTHDFRLASNPLQTRPIVLGPQVWVAADAFVGPGVTVPEGCVIGARAVISGTLEPWSVYAGNPAKRIKARPFDPNA